MLEYFNSKFVQSSLKVKIELFILPLLIYLFLFFQIFNNNNNELSDNPLNDNSFFENKSFDESFTELFSRIEELAIKNNITIVTNERKEKILLLKGDGKRDSIIAFIKDIENINNFTKIDTLIFDKRFESSNYIFQLKIDLNSFYIKNFEKKDQIIVKNEVEKIKKVDFKINAIIGDFALINDNWIKRNEKIENFELIEIHRNFVLLKNEKQEIKLEIYDENNFEMFN